MMVKALTCTTFIGRTQTPFPLNTTSSSLKPSRTLLFSWIQHKQFWHHHSNHLSNLLHSKFHMQLHNQQHSQLSCASHNVHQNCLKLCNKLHKVNLLLVPMLM